MCQPIILLMGCLRYIIALKISWKQQEEYSWRNLLGHGQRASSFVLMNCVWHNNLQNGKVWSFVGNNFCLHQSVQSIRSDFYSFNIVSILPWIIESSVGREWSTKKSLLISCSYLCLPIQFSNHSTSKCWGMKWLLSLLLWSWIHLVQLSTS